MTDTTELDELYASIRDFDGLTRYAEAVYEMIDEEDWDKAWQMHAPWRIPPRSRLLRETFNGDIIIRLPSREKARWRNDKREWELCD